MHSKDENMWLKMLLWFAILYQDAMAFNGIDA